MLPSSMEEKRGSEHIERWMYVHELKKLLEGLEDTDWVTPNVVGNLAVEREGRGEIIAAIDFHFNRIEWYIEGEEI